MKRMAEEESNTTFLVLDSNSKKDIKSDVMMKCDSAALAGDDNSADNEQHTGNSAWADSMRKILRTNKPKRKKTLVLSRAKRSVGKPAKTREEILDFEIEGEVKIEEPDSKDRLFDNATNNNLSCDVKKLKKKEWDSKGHITPNVLEKDREKALSKIATRGVVQLFNAVKEHQKSLKRDLDEAGPIQHKQAKVLKTRDKRQFLDILMGPAKSQPVSKLVATKMKEESDNPTWSILRDDFMMKSKLKDWDKQDESELKDEPLL